MGLGHAGIETEVLEIRKEILERIDREDGTRVYRDASGVDYASVTTILKATSVPGYALKKWIATATDAQREDAREKSVIGSRRGNLLHGKIEDHFTGNVRKLTDEEERLVSPYWKSALTFLKRVEIAHAIELPVVHRKLRYAGSLDFLGTVDGKLALVDWKTCDKKKPEDWLMDYKLQACAYSAACRHELGLVVETAHVVIAIPGERAQVITLKLKDLQHLWKLWKRRVERFQKKTLRGS